MYILPNANEFNNACASVDRSIATKCEVYTGNTLSATMVGSGQNGEIISMEWDNIVCSNDGLQIGTCCMDEFRMTYRPVTTTMSLMNKELRPYVGVDINGTVTYVPLGRFFVTNVSSDDEDRTFSIVSYDGMSKLLGNFDPTEIGITYPTDAWTILSAIASHFNLTLAYEQYVLRLLVSNGNDLKTSDNNILYVQQNINANKGAVIEEPYEGSYRDYIGWMAGLVGANAHMTRDGKLGIFRYATSGFVVGRDVQHMGGAKINFGGSATYTSIISGTDEAPVEPTNYSGNAITYSNPFITTEELDLICDEIIGQNGITVTPCDVTWRSNPCVDAGDIISVADKNGNNQTVYVMERVMRVTGGLAEDLHCYGETELGHELNKSPMIAKIASIAKENTISPEDIISNTEGTFQWIDNGAGTNGGFTIYENGTDSWLRCTAGGIGISNDGGLTYTNAITKNGVVANQLKVVGNGNDILVAKLDYAGSGYEVPNIMFKNTQGAKVLRIDYNDYFKRSSLSISDAVKRYTSDALGLAVGRTGSMPSDGNGGFTNIFVTDPRPDSGSSIHLTTYYSDNDSEWSDSQIEMYSGDPTRRWGRILLSVKDNESNGDDAIIGIYDPGTAQKLIGMEDNNGTPRMFVKSGNSYINLTLKRVNIGGTYYYFLGEQA